MDLILCGNMFTKNANESLDGGLWGDKVSFQLYLKSGNLEKLRKIMIVD